ncbi:MAG TPA: mannitol dehydrogenase family protein, partial [Caulobacteraceae bacterium]|nr:mannitol dehydrogenase family protein [Caulobacteraceae bacterium]
KLRLLNGAHSTLAYLGLLAGLATVAEAMADPALAGFIERLMRADIDPSLPRTRALDLSAYIDSVLARFRNPAIAHQLAQIAWDGSQKLPFRLLGTIADALAAGRPVARLAVPVAAWMVFVARRATSAEPLVDPQASVIAAIAAAPPARQPDLFLAMDAVFPPALAADPRFRDSLRVAHQALTSGRMADLLAR